MQTRRRLRNSRKWYAKTSRALGPGPTYILPSTKKPPPSLPSGIPFYPACSLSVPRLAMNNAIHLHPKFPTFPHPLLMHHHQRPITVLLAIIACVFCIILHPTNTKDLSAKIVLASSSPGHPRLLEHIQPPASKSEMLAFASPCVR